MDIESIGLGIIMLVVMILIAMVGIPVFGETIYYIITQVFGHNVNGELYWTGIGLLTVFAMVMSIKVSGGDD